MVIEQEVEESIPVIEVVDTNLGEVVAENIEKKIIFMSGNTDLTEKQFLNYYAAQLSELVKNENIYFNISDDNGCAAMLQQVFNRLLEDKSRVNVFHMGIRPKNIAANFILIGGFTSLEERDAGMTLSSNLDYHIVISGKGRTLVERNICRRNTPEYDYNKHWLMGNRQFWNLFKKQEEQVK